MRGISLLRDNTKCCVAYASVPNVLMTHEHKELMLSSALVFKACIHVISLGFANLCLGLVVRSLPRLCVSKDVFPQSMSSIHAYMQCACCR